MQSKHALILVLCLGGALIAYLIFVPEKQQQLGDTACTMEAKLCPDGSYVGRVGPNCAFAPCENVPPTR